MLLILTSEKDLTADYLIVELIRRGLPYYRLNAEALSTAGLTFRLDESGVTREVSIGPRALNFPDVTCVWYRRTLSAVPIPTLSPAEWHFVAGELRHLAMGLVLSKDIPWVNPIDRVAIAEHKLFQLQIARKVGFEVPRTLVSRDAAKLRAFVESNQGGTICKPIFHGLFVDEGARYSVYTRRVTADSLSSENVSQCPVLLQEEVSRRADIRATFIGERCFVVEIEGDGVVDWRDPDVSVRYSAARFSRETELMCAAMLRELGLVYGAFDFIRTPDGRLVFLEVNPTGEWAWLQDQLGLPMREAFIDLFFGERA